MNILLPGLQKGICTDWTQICQSEFYNLSVIIKSGSSADYLMQRIQAQHHHFLQALPGSRYCIPEIAGMGTYRTHYIPPQILLDSFTIKD
jgi:hypothetical protein